MAATVRRCKLDQAQAYARRLGLRDALDRFPRDDSGVIWSAEKVTRKQFAYTDQNSILRAYRQGRIAGSADNAIWGTS